MDNFDRAEQNWLTEPENDYNKEDCYEYYNDIEEDYENDVDSLVEMYIEDEENDK